MKTRIFSTIITLMLLIPFVLNAQEKKEQFKERKNEINIKKIAFLTEKLELTAEEAQVFWPVYNDFQNKKEECMKENRGIKNPVNYNNLSDKELNDLADAEIIKASKMLDLRKEFNDNLKKVLPLKKVVMLYDAEKDFKKVLIKDMRLEHKSKRLKNMN